MATDRNDQGETNASDATSKLSRLLETESELEAMLEEARKRAEGIVTAARAAADERVREFESTLENEDQKLARRIADDRDRSIATIRAEASAESERLDALDDSTIRDLARYVVHLLVPPPPSGGEQ